MLFIHKKVPEFFLFKTIPPIFHIGDALQIRSCAGSVVNTNREISFVPSDRVLHAFRFLPVRSTYFSTDYLAISKRYSVVFRIAASSLEIKVSLVLVETHFPGLFGAMAADLGELE